MESLKEFERQFILNRLATREDINNISIDELYYLYNQYKIATNVVANKLVFVKED